jgi:DNA-directed RNA polymerase specialized sigma24 family protein
MASEAGARERTGVARGGEHRWRLTAEALASLLDFLGPDRNEAGRAYERIRRRLVQILEWQGCARPEELADETFDRVAHKLAGGLEVQAEDPLRYFCGVAYRVLKEVLREEQKERAALAEVRHLPPAAADDEAERLLDCLDGCLTAVGEPRRRLLLRYHAGEGRERIDDRRALAAELGLPLNALRIRVHRLRAKIETCVLDCMKVK